MWQEYEKIVSLTEEVKMPLKHKRKMAVKSFFRKKTYAFFLYMYVLKNEYEIECTIVLVSIALYTYLSIKNSRFRLDVPCTKVCVV